ncbi:cytochrome P450 [Streptomyces chromofuscus]|uniref:cytochrome P450 n=1 Tax=Streptomyces chromofuscus TaxID=42881 RepID=UPI001E4BB6BA|nr:cytochrome P450 [Streptomyces chromofuscus]
MRWDEDLGVWLVTGFREATALLRHPALSAAWPERSSTRLHAPLSGDEVTAERTSDLVRRWFMFNDDPAHAHARRIVAPLFSAERVAALRPFLVRLVDELLESAGDELDVMTDLAIPQSSRVICHILGLAPSIAPQLAEWAPDIAALLVADYLPEVAARGHRALREITSVVDEALEGDMPEGSGLWVLRRAQQAGLIDAHDVRATTSLLIYAGFETTSTFIGKAVRATLHADAWEHLRIREPAAAVEELLRFDTSVQQVARCATAPVEVAGHLIAPGDLVLVLLGVANRDARTFDRPDALGLGREIKRHLAFGHGSHYCLGAPLARLEAEVALDALRRRWVTAVPAEPPTTRPHYGITVLEHLKVRSEDVHDAVQF